MTAASLAPRGMDAVGRRTWIDAVLGFAADAPDRPAITTIAGDATETFTYGQVVALARRLAGGLDRTGLRRGDAALLLMGNGAEYAVGLIAVHLLGAVAVTCSTRYAAPEVAYQVSDSGARVVLVDASQSELAAAAVATSGLAPPVVDCRLGADVYGAPPLQGRRPVGPCDPAAIMYTSGSTAHPRGVVLTHGNYVFNVEVNRALHHYGPADRGLCVLPLYHLNGHNYQLVTYLSSGMHLYLADRFSASGFAEIVDRFGITVTNLNATHIKMVLAKLDGDRPAPHGLRRVKMGLELDAERLHEFERRFRTVLAKGYAQTETVVSVTSTPTEPLSARRPMSVGLPTLPYTVAVQDGDGGQVPVGEVGEICVRSNSPHGLCAGYLSDREAVARSSWWRTGDLGHFDADGYLYFAGRAKAMIKRGGLNVAAEEVERVVQSLAGVRACAVIGLPDDVYEEQVVAFVSLDAGAGVSRASLERHCRAALADYKVPGQFFLVDEMPLGEVGKYDKRRLATDHARRPFPAI